ncbi:MAG: hypothetical protein AAFZ15_33575 [Bacteroidota bacterium]
MKQKFTLLTLTALLLQLNYLAAQSPATSKGASIVSGMFSFTSQGGDLYNNFNDDPVNTFMIVPSYYHLVVDKFGVGGDLSFTRTSQGDFSFNTFGFGPKVAYFFDSGNNAIPFAGGGFNYISIGDGDNSEGGFAVKLGGGVIVRKGHLGLSIEAGWLRESYSPDGGDNISGNTIFIGASFLGFLYSE